MAAYMPKYNELKHFNAARVTEKFLAANNLYLAPLDQTISELKIPQEDMKAMIQAGELGIEQPI